MEDLTRRAVLVVRLRDEERETLRMAARRSGRPLSTYVREQVLELSEALLQLGPQRLDDYPAFGMRSPHGLSLRAAARRLHLTWVQELVHRGELDAQLHNGRLYIQASAIARARRKARERRTSCTPVSNSNPTRRT